MFTGNGLILFYSISQMDMISLYSNATWYGKANIYTKENASELLSYEKIPYFNTGLYMIKCSFTSGNREGFINFLTQSSVFYIEWDTSE